MTAGIAAECLDPERVTEDDMHWRARGGREERTVRGRDAEAREIVVADRGKPELRGASVRRESADAEHLREDGAERPGPLLQVLQRFDRERILKAAGVVVLGLRGDRDQLLGARHWQRPQRGVEQTIQRGVGAKADRQGEHSRRREGLMCPQETNGVAEFVHSRIVAAPCFDRIIERCAVRWTGQLAQAAVTHVSNRAALTHRGGDAWGGRLRKRRESDTQLARRNRHSGS